MTYGLAFPQAPIYRESGYNIEDMLETQSFLIGVPIYGTVSLYSPREQETTMYVGKR